MTSALGFNPIVGGVEIQVDGTAVATFKTAGSGFAIPAAVASGDAVRLSQVSEQTVHAYAVFSVTGTTLTVHKSYNIASMTRTSAGLYAITFTTPNSDAFWRGHVNHIRVTNWVNSGEQFMSQTANGGTLNTTENGVSADVGPPVNYSCFTIFK